MADLQGGGGEGAGEIMLDTYGLDLLPTLVGKTVEGPRPIEAVGLPQRNWSGTVRWGYEEIKTPGSLEELIEVVQVRPSLIPWHEKPALPDQCFGGLGRRPRATSASWGGGIRSTTSATRTEP